LLRPKSYFLVNLSGSSGYFNFTKKNNTRLFISKKILYAPSIAYFHKTGLGITVSGNMIHDEKRFNLYQYVISPSIDFLKNRKLIGGFGYTRYITKDSLPFYTTPIKNELSGYITWRKPWLQSSLLINYGWGPEQAFDDRLLFIKRLRLRRRILDYLNSENKRVNDISITASLFHHFYWFTVFTKNDHIRLTPQVQFISGTQRFGFNQPINNNTDTKITRTNALNNARELVLNARKEFKPMSLSMLLKAEYDIGQVFIQPQVILDYYLQADNDKVSLLFSLNVGVSF
jgi:hypothetical protein